MLARCLNSIAPQLNAGSEVIVVDNASQDNSHDVVKNMFPWAKLIANRRNLGFARANNQALEICRGLYVYFLNPDTEVLPGALRTMMDFMDTSPEVGLAGTRIVNPDGSSQSSVERRYPGEKHTKHELKDLKGDIAWVLGASMIARRSILNDVGGFDERFFLYGDDLDLCLAIRKAGWSIGFISDAEVVHWGGQSERNTLPIEIWRKKFDAELIFYDKHYSPRAIRAIKRENVAQALWRLLTLKLTLPFSKDKETSRMKLNKYRLALQIFRN
jgi:N-acetylglucosaminyl-diphospho-decaprenol L-rhamnosyltransferase